MSAANPLSLLSSQVTVTEHLFNLQTDYLVQYRQLRADVARFSRFQLSKAAAHYASLLGIPVDPNAPGSHPHPLSKLVEDYVLRVVVPPLLRDRAYDVMFSKPSKFHRLLSDAPPKTGHTPSLHNYCIEPRDIIRYPGAPPPPVRGVPGEVLFVQDALHFASPDDVLYLFNSSPALQQVVATIVIPPGLLFRLSSDSTPLYSYRTEGASFLYAPDGQWVEHYDQPLTCVWLLHTGVLQALDSVLTITTVATFDACHVILIQRGRVHLPGLPLITMPGRCELPSATLPFMSDQHRFVSKAALTFMIDYAFSVNPPSLQQLRARARLWLSDHRELAISPTEKDVLVNYVKALLSAGENIDDTRLLVTQPSHLVTRTGPARWFRLLHIYLSRHLIDNTLTLRDPPTPVKRLHTRHYYHNGHTKPSVFSTGDFPRVSYLRLRSALISLAAPPSHQPPSRPFDPLLGFGANPSLTREAVKYLLCLLASYIAPRLARRFPNPLPSLVATHRFLTRLRGANIPLAAVGSLPVFLLADVLSLLIVRFVRRAASGLIDVVTHPLRSFLYAGLRRSPTLRRVDFVLHQLLQPADSMYLMASDPDLLYPMFAEPDAPANANTAPPSPSEVPPTPSNPSEDVSTPGVLTPPSSIRVKQRSPVQDKYPFRCHFSCADARPHPTLSSDERFDDCVNLTLFLPSAPDAATVFGLFAQTACPQVTFELLEGSWTGSPALAALRGLDTVVTRCQNPSLNVSLFPGPPQTSFDCRSPDSPPAPDLKTFPGFPIPSADPVLAFTANSFDCSPLFLAAVEAHPNSYLVFFCDPPSPTFEASLPSTHQIVCNGTGCHIFPSPGTILPNEDPLIGSGLTPPELLSPPPPGQTCLIDAFSESACISRAAVWAALVNHLGEQRSRAYQSSPFPLGTPEIAYLSTTFIRSTTVMSVRGPVTFGPPHGSPLTLYHASQHWSAKPNALHKLSSLLPQSRGSLANTPLPDKLRLLCRAYSQQYRLSVKRASAAIKNLENGHLGIVIRKKPETTKQWSSLCDAPPPSSRASIQVSGVLGEPGTGKSYPMFSVLRDHWLKYPTDDDFTIIVGSAHLREQICREIKLAPGRGYRVKTWENALLQPSGSSVLFDDIGLLPPVLDLFLLTHPNVKRVIFTGDPAQGVSQPPSESTYRHLLRPAIDLVSPSASAYLRDGYRLASGVAAQLASVTSNSDPSDLVFLGHSVGPLIVSTSGSVATYTSLERTAMTPASCQGSTIRSTYTLVLDKYMSHADDRALYTALTRGTRTVNVISSSGPISKLPVSGGAIYRGLLRAAAGDLLPLYQAVRDHKIKHTPPQLSDPLRFPGVAPPPLDSLLHNPLLGRSWGDLIASSILAVVSPIIRWIAPSRWHLSKHDYNPATLDEANALVPSLALHYTPLPEAPRPEDFVFPGHVLDSPGDGYNFQFVDDAMLHSPRELIVNPSLASNTIESMYPEARVYGRELDYRGTHTLQINPDDYATAVFLRHRRTDAATEAWTFKERYVAPSRPSTTYLGAGLALFSAFDVTYSPEYPPFNPSVMEQACEEDYAALLEKGPKCLVNIAYRNDPTLDPGKAETFLKSQDVTKLGTEFRKAKKGQMITGFAAAVNARFGGLARYLYRAVRTSLPPEILLLNGVTLEEQEVWFKDHWDFSKPSYEDDYTGFDGTQNEEFLCFQVHLMRAYGIPDDLIDDYVNWVTHLSCMMGPLAIVIASGFKPTWLFNTLDSMAYQALKHDLTPHRRSGHRPVARAFSGDDTLHNEHTRVRDEFYKLDHKFLLISTGGHTDMPHFCGTLNTPSGTFADPELLFLRCLYKLRVGRIFDSALGYAEHAYRLQRNYETSLPHLTSRQAACHAHTIRLLRLVLRLRGLPLVGEFLTKLLPHFYNLSGI